MIHHIPFDYMHTFMRDVFIGIGVPADEAKTCADVLIASDKRGIDSHGIGRLKSIYYDRIVDQKIQKPNLCATIWPSRSSTDTTAWVWWWQNVACRWPLIKPRNTDSAWSWLATLHTTVLRLLPTDGDGPRYDRHFRHQRPPIYCPDVRGGKYARHQPAGLRISDG